MSGLMNSTVEKRFIFLLAINRWITWEEWFMACRVEVILKLASLWQNRKRGGRGYVYVPEHTRWWSLVHELLDVENNQPLCTTCMMWAWRWEWRVLNNPIPVYILSIWLNGGIYLSLAKVQENAFVWDKNGTFKNKMLNFALLCSDCLEIKWTDTSLLDENRELKLIVDSSAYAWWVINSLLKLILFY